MKKLALALAWIVPLAAVAGEPEKKPAVPGEAEKKAAAELVRLVVPRESYLGMIEQTSSQMLSMMPNMPPDGATKMKQVMMEAMPYDEMSGWSAEIYAARFSLAELRELTAFYQTPVGKKAARLLPEISGESMKKAGTVIMQRLPGLMQKHGLVPDSKPDSGKKK
jgi:hypothetical protein